MSIEEQDVKPAESSVAAQEAPVGQEAPVVEGVNVESPSTEQQPQEQAIPYDRFKQVEEENKFLRQKYEQIVEKLVTGKPVEQPAIPQEDPYAGMDPETERAARYWDQRTEKLVEAKARKLAEPLLQQTKVLMDHFSKLQVESFRKENPDILPGSNEEARVVQLLNSGLSKDEAVMAVVGFKRLEAKKINEVKKQVDKVQQKKEANLETTAVPKNNGLPEKKLSFRDEMRLALQGGT